MAPVAHRHVVFTVPKALRPLFERERSLLGLLARTACETLSRLLEAAGEVKDVVPGVVASIQTFGSYANFHPHIHAIATEGTFSRDGTFHAVAWPPPGVLEEAFRRLLLVALVRVERLSEEFCEKLIAWRHSGFSVHASSRVDASDVDGLEPCPPVGRRGLTTSARAGAARERRTGRYVTRPALAAGAVTIREDGQVVVATPPDPQTGSTSVELDPLAFVHAVVTQIPNCGTIMKVVAWITDPIVIERILTHRKKAGLESPFDARGPPASG